MFASGTGHPQLCFDEREPDTLCGCSLAMAKAGSTVGLFGGIEMSCMSLSWWHFACGKCKILLFDQDKCNLFHLSSQMLLHGSFLAVVLAGLHFQDSSQATPCSISSPTHPPPLGFTHCLHCRLIPSSSFQVTFVLELALLQNKCHSLKT